MREKQSCRVFKRGRKRRSPSQRGRFGISSAGTQRRTPSVQSGRAVSSVFAAYQGEVKREYGLLLCRGRTAWSECWQEEARRYAEKYLAPGAGTALDEADRIRAVEITAQALENVYITEGEGRIFADAVTDYMTSAGLGILLQEVLGRLGLYSEEEGLGFIQSLKGMLSDQDSSPQGILENYENLKTFLFR